MNPTVCTAVSIGVFVGTVACLEVGFRLGRHSAGRSPGVAHRGLGIFVAAVFALLALLLGVNLAGGISRLDAQRQRIVKEASAIGRAYFRLDLLPSNEQREMRRLFRQYLDTRLRSHDRLPDLQTPDQELDNAARLQQEIWSSAVRASRLDPAQNVTRLLLPAINEMIETARSRTIAPHRHLPHLIFALLICVALLSGLIAGFAIRCSRHRILYAMVVAVAIYAVLDLDYPSSGLFRLDAADNDLIQVRNAIQ